MSELSQPFAISQPAISKHLKVLERAGLVSVGQEAQRRPRRLNPAPLIEARLCIEHFREAFEASYQRLDGLLAELEACESSAPKKRKRVIKRR